MPFLMELVLYLNVNNNKNINLYFLFRRTLKSANADKSFNIQSINKVDKLQSFRKFLYNVF